MHGGEGTIGFLLARAVSFVEELVQAVEYKLVDAVGVVQYQLEYPAQFILIGAMNPCPCGFLGHPKKQCSCSPVIIRKYQQKLSGPLLDRIDIHISIPPIDFYKDFSKNDSIFT